MPDEAPFTMSPAVLPHTATAPISAGGTQAGDVWSKPFIAGAPVKHSVLLGSDMTLCGKNHRNVDSHGLQNPPRGAGSVEMTYPQHKALWLRCALESCLWGKIGTNVN